MVMTVEFTLPVSITVVKVLIQLISMIVTPLTDLGKRVSTTTVITMTDLVMTE